MWWLFHGRHETHPEAPVVWPGQWLLQTGQAGLAPNAVGSAASVLHGAASWVQSFITSPPGTRQKARSVVMRMALSCTCAAAISRAFACAAIIMSIGASGTPPASHLARSAP